MRMHEAPVGVFGRVFLRAQKTEILIAMQNFDGGHVGLPLRLGNRSVDRTRGGKRLHPSSAPGRPGRSFSSVAQNLCEI
jgi:hypothetical protein